MTARPIFIVASVLAALFALGCRETRPLSWRYEVPASVSPSAIIVARIREGGCNEGDTVIYELRPRDTSRATLIPPELDGDTMYCFDVSAEDPAMGCAQVARSTIAVTLSASAPAPEVVNVLDTAHPRLLGCDSPALCTTEVGCLVCDELDVACDGPARCCAPGVGCPDPPISDTACELR